ncbi:phosphoribosylglycinamide formyltransferase [Sphingomonas sp. ACRSK]|uniref:phosphoribosylglycinamide formyltransferase n=1 Tax=Sphingomonas sp. ACRSK TaxID=2918213 RepID=UPI001EF72D20|nr:phosphoribosylglycinamide formyltransferase [Sphingomonas sp. ACRSK]MCG7347738.1 phosphoribosylglycinamide formyltransferase [Sphingomonas sp. ACRSK]
MAENVRRKLGILISGRGSNMAALVEAARARDCPFEVALVLSDKPEAAGLAWAAGQGVATFAQSPKGMPKAEYEARIDAALRSAGVELIALAGYMRLLSPAFVERWAGRILNIHPSLLPKYKGLDTHARAIDAGDAVAGCSVHLVTEELDAGTVLGQAEVPVHLGDTAEALAARVLVEEHRLYPRILAEFVRSMADTPLARVRSVALALPEAEEENEGDTSSFSVDRTVFARITGDGALATRSESGWRTLTISEDADWTVIGDAIARGWELSAPQALLEAGGR